MCRSQRKRPPISESNHDTIGRQPGISTNVYLGLVYYGKCQLYTKIFNKNALRERWKQSQPSAINYSFSAGMIVIDADGKIGCGMTTNGATHKIPG